jgi:hypothetical protein
MHRAFWTSFVQFILRIADTDGRILGDSEKECYLILTCPSKPETEGYFVLDKKKEETIGFISEEDYEARVHAISNPETPQGPISARVEPKDKKKVAPLYQEDVEEHAKSPFFSKNGQDLPKGLWIKIGESQLDRHLKEFYPIVECLYDPSLEGQYIRRADLEILTLEATEIPDAASKIS